MSGIESASLLENARFNALVVVPNAVQGIFRRRRRALAAATRANVDGHAVGLLAGMSRGHHGGPVWVRVARDKRAAAAHARGCSSRPRRLAGPLRLRPEGQARRHGVFQPEALTISRGSEWRNRRAFAEAVLDTSKPRHRFSQRFDDIAREETEAILTSAGAELGYDEWNLAMRRITRRMVFGDRARDDEALSDLLAELMSEANGMPGEPSERYPELLGLISEHVAVAEEGSLASLFAGAPLDGDTTRPGSPSTGCSPPATRSPRIRSARSLRSPVTRASEPW